MHVLHICDTFGSNSDKYGKMGMQSIKASHSANIQKKTYDSKNMAGTFTYQLVWMFVVAMFDVAEHH